MRNMINSDDWRKNPDGILGWAGILEEQGGKIEPLGGPGDNDGDDYDDQW